MNSRKILVPLAMALTPSGGDIPIHFARDTYLQKLNSVGLEPLFVSVYASEETLNELYDMSDGVLLMGGADINPSHYGREKHEKTVLEDARRDVLEITLTKKTLQDKKPFLGICRGAQVLAVASGGSLHQHLPELFPNESHGVAEGGTYSNLRDVKSAHPVQLVSGSRVHGIVGSLEIRVASGHHQAVENPGNDMKVSGMSPGGVIEVVEHKDPSLFCLGIQGHPEVEGEDGAMVRTFSAFRDAVALYGENKK